MDHIQKWQLILKWIYFEELSNFDGVTLEFEISEFLPWHDVFFDWIAGYLLVIILITYKL